jgi:hypothetical protein
VTAKNASGRRGVKCVRVKKTVKTVKIDGDGMAMMRMKMCFVVNVFWAQ